MRFETPASFAKIVSADTH